MLLLSSSRRRRAAFTGSCLLWLVLLLLTTGTTTTASAQMMGLQSGGGDATLPSFVPAAGAFVDSNNILTLGGSSENSDGVCYLTRIDLATLAPVLVVVVDSNETPTTAATSSAVVTTIPNAGTCTALAHAAGHTLLTGHVGVANQTAAAFQVRVRDGDQFVTPATVFYDDNATAVYPVAIAATEDPATGVQRTFSLAEQQQTTTAGDDRRLALRRITYDPRTGSRQFYRFAYGTTVNGTPVPVHASGLLLLPATGSDQQRLLVTGSTRGGRDAGSFLGAFTGGSVDGFLVRFDDAAAAEPEPAGTVTARLASRDGHDDFARGVCTDHEDPYSYVYVVGSTAGEGIAEVVGGADGGSVSGSGTIAIDMGGNRTANSTSTATNTDDDDDDDDTASSGMQAFVAKIDVTTMGVVWVRQWGGSSDAAAVVEGLACAVAGDTVWVGGTVSAGATVAMDATVAAALGGRDVYVAQVSARDGSLVAVTQTGSDQDDGLVGVAVDAGGNAVVTAYTYGSWYRTRSASEATTTADWVVTTVSRAADAGGDNNNNNNAPTAGPAVWVDTTTAQPSEAPGNVPSNAPSPPNTSTTTTDSNTTATGEEDEETTMNTGSPSLAPITTTTAPSSLRSGGSTPAPTTGRTPTPTTTTANSTDPVTESTGSSLNSAAGPLLGPSRLLRVVWTTVAAAVLVASF